MLAPYSGILASQHGLAAYHRARGVVYGAVAHSVGADGWARETGSTEDLIWAAHVLGDTGELTRLVIALEEDAPPAAEAVRSCDALLAGNCFADGGTTVRLHVHAVTGVAVNGDLRSEMQAAAALCERSALAIENRDLTLAADLDALQRRFLREHASACFEQVGRDLMSSSNELLAAAGSVLCWMVSQDLRVGSL